MDALYWYRLCHPMSCQYSFIYYFACRNKSGRSFLRSPRRMILSSCLQRWLQGSVGLSLEFHHCCWFVVQVISTCLPGDATWNTNMMLTGFNKIETMPLNCFHHMVNIFMVNQAHIFRQISCKIRPAYTMWYLIPFYGSFFVFDYHSWNLYYQGPSPCTVLQGPNHLRGREHVHPSGFCGALRSRFGQSSIYTWHACSHPELKYGTLATGDPLQPQVGAEQIQLCVLPSLPVCWDRRQGGRCEQKSQCIV